ncbi:MAG: sugar phosphate isomerase [Herbinix sp.]|jgi:sugar phosphate isomerase/epimerase|nr:sugar phosphate isomerase [Herbinix sp.]
MGTLPVALQVYTIREVAEKDFVKAMQDVKKMGYDGVELAGLYGHSPEEIRDCLKEIGLTPISAHVAYQEFVRDLQGTVKSYATIGCRYVAIPYLLEEDRYGTERFEEMMNYIPSIAKACKEEGITLLYHNHDFEFLKTTEGEYVLDYMYQTIPADELQMELDTCWVKVVDINPSEYMKKYAGRLPIVHLKDFTGARPIEFRALGRGVQNFPSILEEAIRGGSEWVVVEQDSHTEYTALEDVQISREYLKSLGW